MAKAAFYIVDNDFYIEEAFFSARRLREVMPEVERYLFSPQTVEQNPVFTKIYQLSIRKSPYWFVDCTRYIDEALKHLPYELLFLDSDTYFVEPVPELFELLGKFDMALAHAPGHRTAPTVRPIPDSFPEFNIGVIAMRNTGSVRRLWQGVHNAQVQYEVVFKDNDQAPLREALWNGDYPMVRWTVVPAEYDCRFTVGTYLRDRVKVLHGRAADPARVAQQLNAETQARWGDLGNVEPTGSDNRVEELQFTHIVGDRATEEWH